jgi:TFIIF-interacting CTD phosphatase-like protein
MLLQRITSKVQMSDTLPKNYVKVKYYSKCLNEALDEEMETDTCEEMPIGSTVS